MLQPLIKMLKKFDPYTQADHVIIKPDIFYVIRWGSHTERDSDIYGLMILAVGLIMFKKRVAQKSSHKVIMGAS